MAQDPAAAATGTAGRRTLVVAVPSVKDRFDGWQELVERLRTLPGYTDDECRWELVHHGARRFGRADAEALALDVAATIQQRWVADGGYERVVLTGHSLGGLLVRRAWVHALGTDDPADHREWADAVERIVLFASLNRGVPATADRRWWLPAAAWAARVLPGGRRRLLLDLLRGSRFVTNLRILWIRALNELTHPPLVVQFVGSRDGLVRAEDSTDVESFPTGRQEVVPGATHGDLVRLDAAPDPDARFRLIAAAFTDRRPSAEVPLIGDPDRKVVVVVHGIRASNRTWVADLCRHLEAGWPGTQAVPASYGRFSASKFAVPATRRRFLGWLQDTYTEALAVNPRATFHFVGHSNGTYLLGHSLAQVPAMRFRRVYLAGSVLPTTYAWRERARAGQVQQLRNERAAADVPVAVLCAALRGLGMRDVGTGGVDGFLGFDDPVKTEVAYHPGGHSAALHEANLRRIAAFVMDGDPGEPDSLVREPSAGFAMLSRAAPWLARGVALAAVAAAAAVTVAGPWSPLANAAAVVGAAAAVLLAVDLV